MLVIVLRKVNFYNQWNGILALEKRISSFKFKLPVGIGFGVATTMETIERAKMACREIENFILVLSTPTFFVGY